MDVIVRPHLLSAREETRLQLAPGLTLAEIVAAYPWPAGIERHAVVLMNKQLVPREWWTRIRPHEGTCIDLAVGLSGGDKDKQTLALVASIAISIFAPAAAMAIMQVSEMTIGASVLAAGLAIVGNLAVAAMFKPPPITAGNAPDDSKAYTFQGQSNAFRPYGVLPKVLGQHRVYPDVVGVPYTEITGEDPNSQFLRALYCFGYGDVIIQDVRIGEDPIDKYSPLINKHPSFMAGNPADPLTIFTSDVGVTQYGTVLLQNVATTVLSLIDTDSVTLDIAYQRGLGKINTQNGGVDKLDAVTRIEFRDYTAGGGWLPLADATMFLPSEGTTGPMWFAQVRPVTTRPGYFVLPKGQRDFTVNWLGTPGVPGGWVWIASEIRLIIESVTATTLRTTTGLPEEVLVPDYKNGVTDILVLHVGPHAKDWYVTRNRLEPFITSLNITFPKRSQWEIRLMQVDAPGDNKTTFNQRTVTALRSFTALKTPVVPDVPIALLEVRIKATEQLAGVVNNLSALITSKVPIWTGPLATDWTEPQPSSNPAWLYLDILRGNANAHPVDVSRIDLPAFKAWAAWCDAKPQPPHPDFDKENARCDFVVDKAYTLWELLSSVAATGRAIPTMRDNKYSILVDLPDKPQVQIFSPRNSWGLTARRKYLPLPDALRIKWIDPAAGYKENTAFVYAPGKGANTATVFEDLSLFGCTRYQQAVRDGRVWFARAQLQQEEFSFSTDVENLVCTRGDLIGIAHDVLQVGGWSARLAAISGNLVQFDSDLKPFAEPWALRHRDDAGVVSGRLPFTAPPAQPGWYSVPNLPNTAKVGDLILYGTVGVEQGRYIVKSIQPGNDLTADVNCIEYAPGIYAAELAEALPPYVPQGQSPYSFNPGPVRALAGTVTEWSVARYPHASVALQWAPPASPLQPVSYIVSQVMDDGTVVEIGRTRGLTFLALADVETWLAPYSGAVLTYSVVPQWPGVTGPAAAISVQLPSGVILPLPPITGLAAVTQPPELLVTWDALSSALSADLAYYVIRWAPAGGAWAAAAATEVKVKANRTTLPAKLFAAGDYTVFAVAEDVRGTRGNPVTTTFHIDSPRAVTVSGTAVQNTVFLRWGTLSGVAGGEWSAQTTWQVAYYEVTKQRTPATLDAPRAARALGYGLGVMPAGIVTAQDLFERRQRDAGDTPTDLGKYSGEFAVLSEQQDGQWHYCMRGVDLAGNAAPYACIDLDIFAPDNYVMLDSLTNVLTEPGCTKVNAIQHIDGTWLCPFDTAQTWEQHFVSHGWDQPQDQIDAGFPIYAQPAGTTRATFSWSHDYGEGLPSLHMKAQAFYSAFGGTPAVAVVLYAKAAAGDAWTQIARQADTAGAMLPPLSRYVRVDVEVDSDAAGRALAYLQRVEYVLDVQYRTDAGVVTVPASGVARVDFNIDFVDVRSVQLTPGSAGIAYARYQLGPADAYMDVYAFNASGAAAAGDVSWLVNGV